MTELPLDESSTRYDTIGHGYARSRRPDPRIETQIFDAIGPARSVINVGAGTGNYEPSDRLVAAVEPSATMVEQRPHRRGCVRAVAEHLPLRDDAAEVVTAFFTIHHWNDQAAGIRELGRVAERQVTLVYDPTMTSQMWLREYFPSLATAPWEVEAPDAERIAQYLEVDEVRIIWVPPDCSDGFTGAYWNRPERYLESEVQAGMSTLSRLTPEARAEGTERLRVGIESGQWDRDHGQLRQAEHFDMGYRLVLSRRR